MAATMRIPTEFTAIDKFTSVVSKMTSGVSNFTKSTASAVERVNTKISKGFDKIGRLGQAVLGIGLGGVFALAIQNNIAYNDSLASVSAITGATGNELANLESTAMKTAKAQRMLGADVFKAYELIASAKPELLQNVKLLDEVTNATATLSKAARMDMAGAATSVTTALNQFGLGGEYALKVVDTLAAGTVYGASSITQTSDALAKFGTIAAATGTKVDESIALIQLVSPFEKGAEAGTKLRNVLGKMASADILPKDAAEKLQKYGVNTKIVTDKTLPLSVRLKEMSKIGKDTTAIMQVFGTENAALAQAIFNNVGAFDTMLDNVNKEGMAMDMAEKNTRTFKGAIDAIKASFFNATTATNANNKSLQFIVDTMFYLGENMETVITIVGAVIGAFVAFKVVVGIIRAVAIVQGVYTSVMAAYSAVAVTAALTGASFAAVIWATLWPILAVVAAIGAIILIIKNWSSITEWFGKQWEMFTNWISELWGGVVSFFSEFDFVGFFISIGQAIINYMLFPLKSVLKLVAMIPGGIGEAAQSGLDKLNEMSNLSVMLGQENSQVESPEVVTAQNSRANTLNGNINMTVNDRQNNIGSIQTDFGGIGVNTTKTQGAF